jgi:hypothetical protein
MVSAKQVADYLTSVDFPADKDRLLREAEAEGAPEEVLKALRAIPPVEYASKDEVRRAADTGAG